MILLCEEAPEAIPGEILALGFYILFYHASCASWMRSTGASRDQHTALLSAGTCQMPHFQAPQVALGSLLVSVDYKAKRLDVEALRRGELWQLVNLLPLLEGLQVHFRSVLVRRPSQKNKEVEVKNAKGFQKVLAQVVRAWSSDLNRTQLLRSLPGTQRTSYEILTCRLKI